MRAPGNHHFRFLFAPLVMGVLLLAGGFAYEVVVVGIPFQDPPPALRRRYDRDAQAASAIISAGEYALAGGALLLATAWVIRRIRNGRS